MKITYQLKNSDFLEYQLYTSSKSKLHKKKRFRSRITIPIIYLIIGVYFAYVKEDNIILTVFAIVSVLWFLFYPIYSKWHYKNHFKKHVEENYKNRINKSVEIIFDGDFIKAKDSTSESKINGTEIKELIETKKHFFLKLKTDISIIITKNSIINEEEFKKRIVDLGGVYVDELDWVWK